MQTIKLAIQSHFNKTELRAASNILKENNSSLFFCSQEMNVFGTDFCIF